MARIASSLLLIVFVAACSSNRTTVSTGGPSSSSTTQPEREVDPAAPSAVQTKLRKALDVWATFPAAVAFPRHENIALSTPLGNRALVDAKTSAGIQVAP